jgi:hypothetical protein
MFTRFSFYSFVFSIAILAPAAAWAGHPLTTDDTGTQGRGNFQLEVNGQYDHDKADTTTTTGGQMAASLSYGLSDAIDIIVGAPYLWTRERSDDRSINSHDNGISDTSLDIKVRFYEKEGVSFTLKPGLSLPTGNDDPGAGRLGYHIFLIGTKESGPWTFLANVGYIRNDTDSDFDEKNIWHISAAALYALDDQWKIAADLVTERSSDKDAENDPVSTILGLIYSPIRDIDLDLGIKAGLTSSETDWSLMAGTTFRF